jgi:ribonuclease PH
LDRLQLRLLPVADLFMALMWSRPGGLSLRTTWVTPATIALAVALIPLVGLSGVAALARGLANGGILFVIGGLIALALTAGAATTAVYGVRQRRLSR